MKSKTITAIIIAAALAVFSYVLFFTKTQQQSSFNISGKWKLDSAYATQPINDSIQQLLLATIDSNAVTYYKFNADSTFNLLSSKDSTSEKYYLHDHVMYFDHGYGYEAYPVRTMTDTLFEFINKDSIVFVLRKK